jgi:hypothetical protein
MQLKYSPAPVLPHKSKRSKDCVNTVSANGQNLTPVPVLDAARITLGGIELDVASDEIANKFVKAERFFSLDEDGFKRDWKARTVFCNPPGKTISDSKQISASHWGRKLLGHWLSGDIEHAIHVCYRGGSIGSIGGMLPYGLVCITSGTALSPCVNGAGRLTFDIVQKGERVQQPINTQSSAIILLSHSQEVRNRFVELFSPFGVVLNPVGRRLKEEEIAA